MEMMLSRWIYHDLSIIHYSDLFGESTWKIVYCTFLGHIEQNNMMGDGIIIAKTVNLMCQSEIFLELSLDIFGYCDPPSKDNYA